MRKNRKVYYYEYDENTEQLKVMEDKYIETKNGLFILQSIYIPKSMIHTNKKFTSFNCKIINKKLIKIKSDKYLYAMPFVTGVYKNVFHKLLKNIKTFITKNLQLYLLGTIKLPFIPFIRYFENRKEMSNINIKIHVLEKSKDYFMQLSEAENPQTEKDVVKMLGLTSFDEIKKQYSEKYKQFQSQCETLKQEKKKIRQQETDLSNMTFSLIISFSSLVVAIIALILTCRQPADNKKTKEQKLKSENSSVFIETNIPENKEDTIDNSYIEHEDENQDITNISSTVSLERKKSNQIITNVTPVFKEYKESSLKN